ncbi:MAG: DUF4446 family protein [Actinobacteria bacterium]|nr:DUF4446 family protein [Actinomycetota bacterium]
MTLSDGTLSILVVVALILILLLIAIVVLLSARLQRLHRAHDAALRPGESVLEAVARQQRDLGALRQDVVVVHDNTEHLRELLRGTLSRVGVVRYDAFADMGGALSFSAALLDEHLDGVVISAINGRTETRTYAKPIRAGDSEYNLSPEELAALEAAATGKPPGAPSKPGKRRR